MEATVEGCVWVRLRLHGPVQVQTADLVEAKVPVDDGLEDPRERAVIELEEAEDVKMPQQTRSDVVPTATGRAHRPHHDRIHDRLPRHVLQVIPILAKKCHEVARRKQTSEELAFGLDECRCRQFWYEARLVELVASENSLSLCCSLPLSRMFRLLCRMATRAAKSFSLRIMNHHRVREAAVIVLHCFARQRALISCAIDRRLSTDTRFPTSLHSSAFGPCFR